jgi:tRNA(Arg) A34 adenosine deaminase TadA
MTTEPRLYDKVCIKAAIAQSQRAVEEGCMPFGAVLADASGKILLEARNGSVASAKRGGKGDVTRHAEMELVRKMATIEITEPHECTLYTSTEPCVMCAGAIYWSGVNRVVYGVSSGEMEQQVSGPGGFDIPIKKLYSMGRSGMRKIEIVGPLLADEAIQVHQNSGVWRNTSTYSAQNTTGEVSTT